VPGGRAASRRRLSRFGFRFGFRLGPSFPQLHSVRDRRAVADVHIRVRHPVHRLLLPAQSHRHAGRPVGSQQCSSRSKPTLPPLTPVVCTPPEVITTGTNCIQNACAPTTLYVLPPTTAKPSPSPSPAPRKQYLTVIREINPNFKYRDTFGNCNVDNDVDYFTIQDSGTNHQTKTYKTCTGHDAIEQLAHMPTRGKVWAVFQWLSRH